ncbi:SIR2 family NAD-dependent protein deacylase [Aspergillus homomorphus CBS 101889]|uniref:Uncharacterized protein n=1 Tax=Aspergillus homomorphus (strain CBS 101889) TaxID=1450537 RepID=A0A395HTK8_ASPHC|nr:hypothetical protein BO97DRAFT_415755 [Aspergillus homomorphus CBS 101889]RAL10715.1 hypothetical protein BO97DRAFT_415755 [Aspergillus homomorphus CBS 101889]
MASNGEHPPQGTDEPGPSSFQAQWEQLLANFDPNLLADLRRREPSAHSLYEIERIITGLCRGVQRGHHLNSQIGDDIVDVDATQERARQFMANTSAATREMRRELSWNIREFDISLLRQIRRSSALSLVLGAGASMTAPCNAPSWPSLVEGLLHQTIGRVMELWLPRPQDLEQLPPEAPQGLINERFISRDPYRESAKRYNADEENTAVKVLQRIEEAQRNDKSVNTDILRRGADVGHDLCGQRLLTFITAMLYKRDRIPSKTHHAIARLARSQFVHEREDHFMGWDGIITYNYDDFMEQALSDLQIPSAAIAMRGDEIAVYHVHGYTPTRPFLITMVPFVFATSGYQSQYGQSVSKVLERFQSDYLENPVHVALYIGCSFSDRYMNQLLRDAFERRPGRYHYALLPWPGGLADDHQPSGQEIKQRSGQYLAMGIRPIWLRSLEEIPHIISQLE